MWYAEYLRHCEYRTRQHAPVSFAFEGRGLAATQLYGQDKRPLGNKVTIRQHVIAVCNEAVEGYWRVEPQHFLHTSEAADST